MYVRHLGKADSPVMPKSGDGKMAFLTLRHKGAELLSCLNLDILTCWGSAVLLREKIPPQVERVEIH